jgi:hypothetical protein
MNNSSTLIKGLILPLIIKLSKGNLNDLPDDFWNQFANDFIHYEIDAQPVYSTLYKLELQNPEDVFDKLPQAYSNFINELAEEYVLGSENEIIIKLLESNNKLFLKEVIFLKTMKAVITKLGRQDIKENLPEAYDRLVFELDEEILKQVAKKKARENLKAKFKQWDKELVEEEADSELIEYSIVRETNSSFDNEESIYPTNPKRKVISLSWIKYAAAACIVLTAGIMYFKFNSGNNFVQPSDNNVVTTEVPKIETYPLAAVSSISESSTFIEETSSAFASKPKVVRIVKNNQSSRIESIIKAIEKYQMQLQKNFPNHKVQDNSTIKKLNDTIVSLKNELELLKIREKQYVFNGKSLTLFVSSTPKEDYVLFFNEVYYLKKADGFYKLSLSKEPQNYKKETDTAVLNDLKEILFRKYGI